MDQQTLIKTRPSSIRNLYEQYAGMLLGYIFGIVKDRKLAEEYLVRLFGELSLHFHEINWDRDQAWTTLQQFARKSIAGASHGSDQSPVIFPNWSAGALPESDQLTENQKYIFYSTYYQGKSVSTLSTESNQSEELIRKTLKEAFAIIRRSGEN